MSTNVSAVTSPGASPDASFDNGTAPAADEQAARPQPPPQPASRPKTQEPAENKKSVTCVAIDSPPPRLCFDDENGAGQNQQKQQQQSSRSKSNNFQQQQQQSADLFSLSPSSALESCPLCVFDSTRVLNDLNKLQLDVAKLTMRAELQEQRGQSDRAQIDACLGQLHEYTVSLGIVGKWTSSVGGAIPRMLRAMASASTYVEPSEVLVRSEVVTTTTMDQHQQQQQRGAGGSDANMSGRMQQQQQSTQHNKENDEQQQQQDNALDSSHLSAVSSIHHDKGGGTDGAAPSNSSNANLPPLHHNQSTSITSAFIPISEVRQMFSSFRDEIVRLREKNEILEQRLNDAVCKFEGSNINKLKAEVEGRLRTMLHSLHETMNGTNSPNSELAQQVNSLRTEVEMLKSKTDAAQGSRSVLEARVNDCAAKLRDMNDSQMERSRFEQQKEQQQRDELRDMRAAVKELGSTVSQRLESERSAREFDSGDIRSQLRVLLRSPSPIARLGDPVSSPQPRAI